MIGRLGFRSSTPLEVSGVLRQVVLLAAQRAEDSGDGALGGAAPPPPAPEYTDFVMSREAEASDGWIVELESMDITSFAANPVAPGLGHNWREVVGRWENVAVNADTDVPELRGRLVWDLADEDAAEVAGKYGRGFLNAVSIAWTGGEMVARSTLPTDHRLYKEAEIYSYEYGNRRVEYTVESWLWRNARLLECSPVVVPADSAALAIRGQEDAMRAIVTRALLSNDLPLQDALCEALNRALGRLESKPGRTLRRFISDLSPAPRAPSIPTPTRNELGPADLAAAAAAIRSM